MFLLYHDENVGITLHIFTLIVQSFICQVLSSQCPDVSWVMSPAVHFPRSLLSLGPPTSLTWASQLLTSYLSLSSFCGDTRRVYIQQRAAYVTLLFKNINLSVVSKVKSKLPSLTWDSGTILACVFMSPHSHICVFIADCSLCILASCAFLPTGNITSSQNCPLGKPPMAYGKFHCSFEISLRP